MAYGQKKFSAHRELEPERLGEEDYAAPTIDEANIEAIFTSFDSRRKPRVWLFGVGVVLSIIVAAIVFQNLGEKKDAAFVPLVLGSLLSYAPLGLLQNAFKDELIPQILSQYGFTYDRKAQRIHVADYKDVLPSYTRAQLADHFWGVHSGIKMSVCELTLKRKSGKNTRTVFDGLLCRFDYPKTTKADVAVKSDAGAIGQFFQGVFGTADRVKLEDPTFEAQFDVYSRDQVGARYILTPTVMERILALEAQHRGLRAIFRGSEVLLAIPDGTDLFNPGSFLKPLDRGIVGQFHRDMMGIFEFIDALKLDAQSKI